MRDHGATVVTSTMERHDVVVLGGGPAGLAAAWEVALAGRRALVVEREPVLGGLCATVERDGFRFDLGGHRIISKRADLVDRLRALMGDELLERERRSVIVLGGRRYAYPLVASELITRLPKTTLARAARDYARERFHTLRHGPARDVTFRDWVTHRFGQTLYDLFFGPYTEKLWGIPATELSADWASQRISLLNLGDVGLRLLGLRRGGARTYARRYLYPRRGIGQLFERLVEELRARGVVFVTRAEVTALERGAGGRVTAVRLRTPEGERVVACDAVLSTAPLQRAAALLAPGSDAVAAHAAALRHRGLRFLNLRLRGAPMLDATWAYVPEPRFTMTRIQEPVQRSPEMAPPGHTSLMLEVPADPGDPLWTLPDALLYERLATELASLGLEVRSRTLDCFSTYAPHAYPVYALGYRAARDALLAVVDEPGNVWTFGRQGLFRYVFMDTAMEMGFAAARAWLGGARADAEAMLAIDSNPTLHEVQSVAA
jgi:protoporphyrinogen oxidase